MEIHPARFGQPPRKTGTRGLTEKYVSVFMNQTTKETQKACTFCHIRTGSKELNEAGRCYLDKKTLAGYAPKEKQEEKK